MEWNERRTSLTSWGKPPACIEPVTGELVLKNLRSARSVSVQPLDGAGRPLGGSIPARQSGQGWTFRLGEPGGTNGVPVPYSHRQIENEELYDLAHDIGEATDVSQQHPEIVKHLEAEVEKARADLGDALTKRPGPGRREPGSMSRAGTPPGK
ncbi:MAG: hypothetical protein ACLQM8_20705 [Limisphaerales bacterium]